MQRVRCIIFRRLTTADFFNINKPSGTEAHGGGQAYIDVSTSSVPVRRWRQMLAGVPEQSRVGGPAWEAEIRSLGVPGSRQKVTIAQRRPASVAIRSQKLTSREANRVLAWRPDRTGFPRPVNPRERESVENLVVYLVRLENGEVWAGWFRAPSPEVNWQTNDRLNSMFHDAEGFIEFTGEVLFDPDSTEWPFVVPEVSLSPPGSTGLGTPATGPILAGQVPAPTPGPGGPQSPMEPAPAGPAVGSDAEQLQQSVLFDEDDKRGAQAPPEVRERLQRVRVRDQRAVRKLKQLYGNKCQITGDRDTFRKRDGEWYSEAHHLVPLGQGGLDDLHNLVILSPLLHRMLHYARVEGLDLTRVRGNRLQFKINGKDYVLTWDPRHAEIVTSGENPPSEGG